MPVPARCYEENGIWVCEYKDGGGPEVVWLFGKMIVTPEEAQQINATGFAVVSARAVSAPPPQG